MYKILFIVSHLNSDLTTTESITPDTAGLNSETAVVTRYGKHISVNIRGSLKVATNASGNSTYVYHLPLPKDTIYFPVTFQGTSKQHFAYIDKDTGNLAVYTYDSMPAGSFIILSISYGEA